MSLKTLSEVTWQEVNSSNIKRIAFDEESTSILVEFKDGGQYAYDDCNQKLFDDFKNAQSVGKFFHQNIKPKAWERLN